jgi:hypothetical protein
MTEPFAFYRFPEFLVSCVLSCKKKRSAFPAERFGFVQTMR